jgi:YidC/Oxa1 family membrane protein insertase
MIGGIFDPLYSIVGWVLALFYIPVQILGVDIIALTIVVMAIQFPLIAKQTRSMIQMQRVQPEIKRIQQKYKDDRQKQNEELLKFYQENKINPLAGCLPLLLILPIGIAVFGTFRRGLQNHIPQTGSLNKLYLDLCSVGNKVLPTTVPKGTFKGEQPLTCNEYINGFTRTVNGKVVHVKGTTPSAMHFLGMKLNLSPAQAMHDGLLTALPYLLMVALIVATGWYQVRQTQARQLQRGGAQPNAQMQAVTRIMPIFFGLISYTFNAATAIYFVVSNFWRIGQQHLVLNKMYEEAIEAGDIKAKDAPRPQPKAGEPKTKPPPAQAAPPDQGSSGNGEAKTRPNPNAARRKKKRKR